MTDVKHAPDSNEVISALNILTRNGELSDYDDEIANRLEDAKWIVRHWQHARGALLALANELSWDVKTRPISERIRAIVTQS